MGTTISATSTAGSVSEAQCCINGSMAAWEPPYHLGQRLLLSGLLFGDAVLLITKAQPLVSHQFRPGQRLMVIIAQIGVVFQSLLRGESGVGVQAAGVARDNIQGHS